MSLQDKIAQKMRLHVKERTNEEKVTLIYQLALLGLTEERMAEAMGVSPATVSVWKESVPGFADALYRGKSLADGEVVAALHRSCTGYDCDEQHVSMYRGQIIVTTVKRHYPPNVRAIEYWLGARQRELWNHSQRLELTQNNQYNIGKIDLSVFSEEMLQLMEKAVTPQSSKEDAGGN